MVEKLHIHGAAEMAKVLEALPEHLAKKSLVKALRLAGEVVREAAEVTAPRDSGELAKNIIVRSARGNTGTGATVQVGPSSDVFYGLFTEIGTKNIMPKRWLTRAFDFSAEQALHVLGAALGRELEQTAEKLAGDYKTSGARAPGRFRL